MSQNIKERIKDWVNTNNGHPCDNESLYGIVVDTIDNKISETIFDEVIGEKKAVEVYSRYEDLRNCLLFYKKRIEN